MPEGVHTAIRTHKVTYPQQGTNGSILGPYYLPDILARTLAATFRRTDRI
jgi:hypothetical protein